MIVDERLGNNAKKDLMIEKKGVNQFAAQMLNTGFCGMTEFG